ncbi:kinase-like protein [Dichomitus squalens LYAD-421 SS1]|uniref:mitogen-activated protein kinase kinase n=1 Tax=Dichomitus squalens (strain LYAD-421) TaxID=732165 RepID=R7SPI8_DICSQ|nr:kinase-like protein [Dichomitus squalens LYAD-421 SS1]EJF58016.1 kinase-like protein [Dichomitus squalens LYAD-421 SS1]
MVGFTRQEYLRELEVFKRINEAPETHRFLSTLKMSWEDLAQDRIFFVMDLYPTELLSVLAGGMPITMRDRELYCRELICAVTALRDLGIIHRDIKPGNVLIDVHGRAVLSDFGSAINVLSDSEDDFEYWKCYDSVGTPAYMAPEVAAVNVTVTGYRPCADIWSLGLVFLEIFGNFSGPYFPVTTIEAIRTQHAKLDPIEGLDVKQVPLLELPPGLMVMLEMMLRYHQEERFTVQDLYLMYQSYMYDSEASPAKVAHDWKPAIVSPQAADDSDVTELLSFRGFAKTMPLAPEEPAELEYRAPRMFE